MFAAISPARLGSYAVSAAYDIRSKMRNIQACRPRAGTAVRPLITESRKLHILGLTGRLRPPDPYAISNLDLGVLLKVPYGEVDFYPLCIRQFYTYIVALAS